MKKMGALGFNREKTAQDNFEDMKKRVFDSMKKTFKPEFLNRIDDSIVFHSLDEAHITKIVDLMLKEIQVRLEENELTIEVSPEAKALIVKEGFDSEYGARPLRRAIQRLIEDSLADELLKGEFKAGDHIYIKAEDGKMIISK